MDDNSKNREQLIDELHVLSESLAQLKQEALERRWASRRLAAQYSVTRTLAQADSLAEATPKILQAICETVGWDVGTIWRVDRSDSLLRCVDVWHVPGVDVSDFEKMTRRGCPQTQPACFSA